MNFLLGLLMLSLSFIAYTEDISINVNKNNPSFTVTLAANPTTGFQWTVEKLDKKLLTLTNSTYQKPASKAIGAGGQMLYTFSLNKGKVYPKSTQLNFKYARPWEKEDTGIKQKVLVHFISS